MLEFLRNIFDSNAMLRKAHDEFEREVDASRKIDVELHDPSRPSEKTLTRDGEEGAEQGARIVEGDEENERLATQLTTILSARKGKQQAGESDARYRSIMNDVIDRIPVGLFILNADCEVVWVNEALTRFYGMEREALVGQDMRRLVHTRIQSIFADPEAFAECILATYDDNTYTQQFQTHVLPAAGRKERWLEHWSRPIQSGFYAGGRIEIYTDVTALRRAADEVTAANLILERRNQEMQDFAYVASHDLQEPLRKIGAFSDLLEEDYAERLGEEGGYFLGRIRDSAERMAGLLDALLAYSRVSTRGRPFQPIDLNEMTASVLSDMELTLSDTEATVTVDELPTVEGDPVQLRQLLQNLIGNAVKYRHDGVDPVVEVHGSVEGRSTEEVCRVEVKDNGIGFDDAHIARIFEPFERLHGRSAYEGTGMGLAICRRIVERHGGTITAESIPGEGSTFIVTLPLRQDTSDREATAATLFVAQDGGDSGE